MEHIDRQSAADEISVSVHRCSSDRVVFVEKENDDAWIATDTVSEIIE